MEDTENRAYGRQESQNLFVDISDGNCFYSGAVSNISPKGLCLQEVSQKLSDDLTWLEIVVGNGNANFKMKVRPRWNKPNGYTKDIGVRIVHSSPGWERFVQNEI